jgi:hypothetical protein
MNDEEVRKVLKLQSIRRMVVYGALGLLVLSFFQRGIAPLVYLRAALWAAAGVLSILEATGLKKIGQPATNAWVNAALYFGVAVLPIFYGR